MVIVEEPPLYLDIRLRNLCNLKCRMCYLASNSKVEQEQKELILKNEMDKRFFNWGRNKEIRNREIWKTIYKWIPGIRRLYFSGGEPTLIKENWNLINYLKEKDYSKNIFLECNTNCTQSLKWKN